MGTKCLGHHMSWAPFVPVHHLAFCGTFRPGTICPCALNVPLGTIWPCTIWQAPNGMHQMSVHQTGVGQNYFIRTNLCSNFELDVGLAPAISRKMVLINRVQDRKMDTFTLVSLIIVHVRLLIVEKNATLYGTCTIKDFRIKTFWRTRLKMLFSAWPRAKLLSNLS